MYASRRPRARRQAECLLQLWLPLPTNVPAASLLFGAAVRLVALAMIMLWVLDRQTCCSAGLPFCCFGPCPDQRYYCDLHGAIHQANCVSTSWSCVLSAGLGPLVCKRWHKSRTLVLSKPRRQPTDSRCRRLLACPRACVAFLHAASFSRHESHVVRHWLFRHDSLPVGGPRQLSWTY